MLNLKLSSFVKEFRIFLIDYVTFHLRDYYFTVLMLKKKILN